MNNIYSAVWDGIGSINIDQLKCKILFSVDELIFDIIQGYFKSNYGNKPNAPKNNNY